MGIHLAKWELGKAKNGLETFGVPIFLSIQHQNNYLNDGKSCIVQLQRPFGFQKHELAGR